MFIETRKNFYVNLSNIESIGIDGNQVFARVYDAMQNTRIIYNGTECEAVLNDIIHATGNGLNVLSLEKYWPKKE